MKYYFKVIGFYLGYILYVLATVSERRNYIQALEKGYDCTHSHDDSFVLYGSVTMFYFDKTKPPTRHYLTFGEYKERIYPKK